MPRSEPFELVIFDCDGVLVDSETLALPVLGTMLAELGVELETDELHRRFGGLSIAQVMTMVAETLGSAAPPTFEAEFDRRSAATLREELVPIDGVAELLEGLKLPFATASNAETTEIHANLGFAGLRHFFEGRIFTATDVEHPKPAPDLYLLAASTLGFDPGVCAVVEDTPTGAAAGAAAGMHVFGYSTRNTPEQLIEAGARDTFTHMSQLPALLEGGRG